MPKKVRWRALLAIISFLLNTHVLSQPMAQADFIRDRVVFDGYLDEWGSSLRYMLWDQANEKAVAHFGFLYDMARLYVGIYVLSDAHEGYLLLFLSGTMRTMTTDGRYTYGDYCVRFALDTGNASIINGAKIEEIKAKTHRVGNGYNVEIKAPLTVLVDVPAPESVIGFNLCLCLDGNKEKYFWIGGEDAVKDTRLFGYLEFTPTGLDGE